MGEGEGERERRERLNNRQVGARVSYYEDVSPAVAVAGNVILLQRRDLFAPIAIHNQIFPTGDGERSQEGKHGCDAQRYVCKQRRDQQ